MSLSKILEMQFSLFKLMNLMISQKKSKWLLYYDMWIKKGHVIECFIGIEHVPCTTTLSLKATIDGLFSRHGLSMSRLRGQGYDGVSNMQGEFNGLKTLILKENECAFYVHWFAHQL